MSAEPFIGRTITGLEVDDYNRRWLLRLDDGTAVEFAVRGYDNEDVTVVHLTDEVIEQRAREAAEFERIEEENRKRRQEAAEKQRAHMAQMRAELDTEAFEKWRCETYPTLSETLKDVWTGPLVAEQFQTAPR